MTRVNALRVFSKFHRFENKGVQAVESRDAADTGRPRQVYVLNERPAATPARLGAAAKKAAAAAAAVRGGAAAAAEPLLLEDVGGNEYRIVDKRRRSSWSDETPGGRQELYYKRGGAEILRIVSTDDSLDAIDSSASPAAAFDAFDEAAGKKAIMDRFLAGQDAGAPQPPAPGRAVVDEADAERNKLAEFGRDVLLTK